MSDRQFSSYLAKYTLLQPPSASTDLSVVTSQHCRNLRLSIVQHEFTIYGVKNRPIELYQLERASRWLEVFCRGDSILFYIYRRSGEVGRKFRIKFPSHPCGKSGPELARICAEILQKYCRISEVAVAPNDGWSQCPVSNRQRSPLPPPEDELRCSGSQDYQNYASGSSQSQPFWSQGDFGNAQNRYSRRPTAREVSIPRQFENSQRKSDFLTPYKEADFGGTSAIVAPRAKPQPRQETCGNNGVRRNLAFEGGTRRQEEQPRFQGDWGRENESFLSQAGPSSQDCSQKRKALAALQCVSLRHEEDEGNTSFSLFTAFSQPSQGQTVMSGCRKMVPEGETSQSQGNSLTVGGPQKAPDFLSSQNDALTQYSGIAGVSQMSLTASSQPEKRRQTFDETVSSQPPEKRRQLGQIDVDNQSKGRRKVNDDGIPTASEKRRLTFEDTILSQLERQSQVSDVEMKSQLETRRQVRDDVVLNQCENRPQSSDENSQSQPSKTVVELSPKSLETAALPKPREKTKRPAQTLTENQAKVAKIEKPPSGKKSAENSLRVEQDLCDFRKHNSAIGSRLAKDSMDFSEVNAALLADSPSIASFSQRHLNVKSEICVDGEKLIPFRIPEAIVNAAPKIIPEEPFASGENGDSQKQKTTAGKEQAKPKNRLVGKSTREKSVVVPMSFSQLWKRVVSQSSQMSESLSVISDTHAEDIARDCFREQDFWGFTKNINKQLQAYGVVFP